MSGVPRQHGRSRRRRRGKCDESACLSTLRPTIRKGKAASRDFCKACRRRVGPFVTIDVRWAAADVELMKRFAKELIALEPDLIFTSSTPATAAMLQATRTIPVVFALVADPVGSGFVASLPRPGGNVTGFTPIVGSLGGKWVELLKEIAPSVGRISMVFNPQMATYVEGYLSSFKAAAASLGMEASVAPFTTCTSLNCSFPKATRIVVSS